MIFLEVYNFFVPLRLVLLRLYRIITISKYLWDGHLNIVKQQN
jgi:hypothetical protein